MKSFNWLSLDRDKLRSIIYPLGDSIIGKSLDSKDIHSMISAKVKSELPIRTKLVWSKSIDKNSIAIGGAYYSCYDVDSLTHIQILFHYYFWNTKTKLNHKQWNKVCTLFADTVLHEIIHLQQFRSREHKDSEPYMSSVEKKSKKRSQEYYGKNDEIEAYSFNIACELVDKFGNDIKKIEKYVSSSNVKRTSSYYTYLELFDFDHLHPVVVKLKSGILKWVPLALQGKPFLESKYLTY